MGRISQIKPDEEAKPEAPDADKCAKYEGYSYGFTDSADRPEDYFDDDAFLCLRCESLTHMVRISLSKTSIRRDFSRSLQVMG